MGSGANRRPLPGSRQAGSGQACGGSWQRLAAEMISAHDHGLGIQGGQHGAVGKIFELIHLAGRQAGRQARWHGRRLTTWGWAERRAGGTAQDAPAILYAQPAQRPARSVQPTHRGHNMQVHQVRSPVNARLFGIRDGLLRGVGAVGEAGAARRVTRSGSGGGTSRGTSAQHAMQASAASALTLLLGASRVPVKPSSMIPLISGNCESSSGAGAAGSAVQPASTSERVWQCSRPAPEAAAAAAAPAGWQPPGPWLHGHAAVWQLAAGSAPA